MKVVGVHLRIFSLLALLLIGYAQRMEWDASNIPNPTAGDFQRCNMRTTSNICDPDGILTEQQRYRLNHELHQLESRTRQETAPDFCQKKGVTAAMAVVKHVRGGTEEAARAMANSILKKWSLDQQCQKSVVIVVATNDRRFWVARDVRVPVYANEFTDIFNAQKSLFSAGKYDQALGNILQQTWEKALEKKSPITTGDRGGEAPAPPLRPYSEDTSRKIPLWVWLIPLLLLPLLCCCCTCYFCCCRRKGSNSEYRAGQPADVERGGYKPQPPPPAGYPTGGGYAAGGGGPAPSGGSRGFNNFLSGLGGAGLGSLAGRFITDRFGRNRREAAGPAPRDDQGYRPGPEPTKPTTTHTTTTVTEERTGGGLYPTAAVHDQGGGGSW